MLQRAPASPASPAPADRAPPPADAGASLHRWCHSPNEATSAASRSSASSRALPAENGDSASTGAGSGSGSPPAPAPSRATLMASRHSTAAALASALCDLKDYWLEPPWFETEETDEARVVAARVAALVAEFGPEPNGAARASNPECDALIRAIVTANPSYVDIYR